MQQPKEMFLDKCRKLIRKDIEERRAKITELEDQLSKLNADPFPEPFKTFYELSKESKTWLADQPCESIGLKNRALQIASWWNKKQLIDIVMSKEEELLKYQGVGKKMIRWIKDRLQSCGFSFSMGFDDESIALIRS